MCGGRKASRQGSEQRRLNILDATLRIIVRDGLRGVRHRAVAAEAGVPLSATTYYFRDIKDLISDSFVLFVERSSASLSLLWADIARDLQRMEDQWFRAKAFDTSLPLGPWIETELAHDDVAITARINGEVKQNGNSQDMILDVPNAIAMISEITTLLPGDVILTGTPAGVTRMEHGDVVEVEIEDIGVLRNPVIRRD